MTVNSNTGLVERIHNHLAQFGPASHRIATNKVTHGGVIPAIAGLQFFRGHHVAGVGRQHVAGFHRSHQTGIKTNKFKGIGHLGINRSQRVFNFQQGQTIAFVLLVKADAGNAAAAVIPENQPHFFGRIGRHPPIQKFGQRFSAAHIGTIRFFDLFHILIFNHKTLGQ